MGWPVLDVKVRDHGVGHVVKDDEVVWFICSSIGALAVPVGLAVAVDNMSLCAGDGDIITTDVDGVKIGVGGCTEGLYSRDSLDFGD
jgi:hypothetical protein